jgi:hypothetical protein
MRSLPTSYYLPREKNMNLLNKNDTMELLFKDNPIHKFITSKGVIKWGNNTKFYHIKILNL